jgi:hypothetical protein
MGTAFAVILNIPVSSTTTPTAALVRIMDSDGAEGASH